jgi:uncharacterized membrane protein
MDSVELILAVFPEDTQAAAALDKLKSGEEDSSPRLVNAAILAKDAEGRTAVREDQDMRAGRGSLFGALVGGVIGLLGGPAGAVVGVVAGAATGGLVAGKTDLGFDDAFLNELKGALQPRSSALLLLLEEQWGEPVAGELEQSGAKLYRHAMRQEILERLANLQDDQS